MGGSVLARRRLLHQGLGLAGFWVAAGCGLLPSMVPESPRTRRIGYFAETAGGLSGAGNIDGISAPGLLAFRSGLRDLGYDVGTSLELDLRLADIGQSTTYEEHATDLVASRPDVLVASRTGAALALVRAVEAARADTIPLVFVAVGAPVEIGLVQSLSRPGRNMTGLASFRPDLGSKRLELLAAAAPEVRRPAVIWNPRDPDDAVELAAMQAAAPRLGLTMLPVEVQSTAEMGTASDTAVRLGADALILIAGLGAGMATLATRLRLPTVMSRPDAGRLHGALFALGADTTAMHRRAAILVDKILRGARAADLPVEQPTTFDLVVNLQTARNLGLTIPQSVLTQATEIVQ